MYSAAVCIVVGVPESCRDAAVNVSPGGSVGVPVVFSREYASGARPPVASGRVTVVMAWLCARL